MYHNPAQPCALRGCSYGGASSGPSDMRANITSFCFPSERPSPAYHSLVHPSLTSTLYLVPPNSWLTIIILSARLTYMSIIPLVDPSSTPTNGAATASTDTAGSHNLTTATNHPTQVTRPLPPSLHTNSSSGSSSSSSVGPLSMTAPLEHILSTSLPPPVSPSTTGPAAAGPSPTRPPPLASSSATSVQTPRSPSALAYPSRDRLIALVPSQSTGPNGGSSEGITGTVNDSGGSSGRVHQPNAFAPSLQSQQHVLRQSTYPPHNASSSLSSATTKDGSGGGFGGGGIPNSSPHQQPSQHALSAGPSEYNPATTTTTTNQYGAPIGPYGYGIDRWVDMAWLKAGLD